MADAFTTGIQLPDLTEGRARNADQEGLLRIFSRQKKLYGVDVNNVEYPLSGESGQTVFLNIDNGNASTVFQDYVLRLDFGKNGANINPTGTP